MRERTLWCGAHICLRSRTQARGAGLAHAQRLAASRRPGDLREDDAAERPVHGLNA